MCYLISISLIVKENIVNNFKLKQLDLWLINNVFILYILLYNYIDFRFSRNNNNYYYYVNFY